MYIFYLVVLDGFVILREHLTDSLSQTYDSYELQSESAVSEVVHSLLTFNPQPSTPQVCMLPVITTLLEFK